MPKWPNTIPEDLRRMLETLDQRRFPTTDQDRWGVIQEWLERHGVEVPEKLPTRPEQGRVG